jgi:alcohol dehydrogenase (cytochrome c)
VRDGNAWREKPIEPKSDWTTYNGDLSGNRHSPLADINTSNVRDLGLTWLFPVPGSPRIEATPIVVDGIIYITAWNEVYALDSTTGRQIWAHRQPHTPGLLSNAGKGANRGVAVLGNRVFMVMDNAHMLAFDRFTGAKLWDVEMQP